MFFYYLRIAIHSLQRYPLLSSLKIVALAIGIAACMTSLAIYSLMASNPIPQKSAQLFSVRLDSWDPNSPWDEPNVPPPELTYRDATALMQSTIPTHQSVMYKGAFALQPVDKSIPPYLVEGRIAYRDFFEMFDVPFQYGSAWDGSADKALQQVVVLSKESNDKLFGGENSVGRSIKLDDREYKVVGVLARWHPVPKFYDVNNGAFNDEESVFLPWRVGTAFQIRTAGNTNGWKPEDIDTHEAFLNSEMTWLQFWVQLDNAEQLQAYRDYVDNYVKEQKKLGRFARPLNNRVTDVMQFMRERKVVDDDSSIMVGLSFLFLSVCLINMVGLLLAKFHVRSGELALRRALGATRSQIIQMNLVEVAVIGVVGGLLGLLLSYFGLQGVRALLGFENNDLTHLNTGLATQAIVIAIVASLIAGIYPAYQSGRRAIAGLLKTQ